MSDHAYASIAGIVFLLVAIAHLLRMALGTPVVVQGVSIPMWASAIALMVTAALDSTIELTSAEDRLCGTQPERRLKRRNGEMAKPEFTDLGQINKRRGSA